MVEEIKWLSQEICICSTLHTRQWPRRTHSQKLTIMIKLTACSTSRSVTPHQQTGTEALLKQRTEEGVKSNQRWIKVTTDQKAARKPSHRKVEWLKMIKDLQLKIYRTSTWFLEGVAVQKYKKTKFLGGKSHMMIRLIHWWNQNKLNHRLRMVFDNSRPKISWLFSLLNQHQKTALRVKDKVQRALRPSIRSMLAKAPHPSTRSNSPHLYWRSTLSDTARSQAPSKNSYR